MLFQGVRLPAPAPAPTLPRALKGTLADRIDGRVAAFAAASLVAHLGVMIAANLNDPPGKPTMAHRATETYTDDTIALIGSLGINSFFGVPSILLMMADRARENAAS